jgi:cell division protein FtsB
MKEVKRRILRILLVAEMLGLSGWYMLSTGGVRALKKASWHNEQLLHEIKELERETLALKEEIEEREKDSFYKEKIAREELQMAREDEEIYLLLSSRKVI